MSGNHVINIIQLCPIHEHQIVGLFRLQSASQVIVTVDCGFLGKRSVCLDCPSGDFRTGGFPSVQGVGSSPEFPSYHGIKA